MRPILVPERLANSLVPHGPRKLGYGRGLHVTYPHRRIALEVRHEDDFAALPAQRIRLVHVVLLGSLGVGRVRGHHGA